MYKESVWETNYRANRYNRYPHSEIVSFILSNFGNREDRDTIKILDLGCGGGNNFLFLCSEGFDSYAVDGSETSIRLTKSQTKDYKVENKIKLCSFEKLEFESRFFDCVIDRQSLGHNESSKLPPIVKEVYRVLKPDGIFFGMVFSSFHPQRLFGARLDNTGDMSAFSEGVFERSGLVHFFTVHELIHLFKDFQIIDIVHRSDRSIFGELDSRLNSDQFLVRARKPEKIEY